MHRSFYGALIGAALLLAACSFTPTRTELSLVATVGTDPDACATDALLELATTQPQTVYTCYTITNEGETGVTVHDLTDDLHGEVLFGFEYALAPGTSVTTFAAGVVLESVVDADTVNEARWDGFTRGQRAASATASSAVRLVPPRQYGAVAGTFVAASNLDTIVGFDGNLLLLGALDLAGEPLTEPFDITITPPGVAPFVVTFDPATAPDGVMALIVEDFGSGVSSVALAGLGVDATVVTVPRGVEAGGAVGTSAALSGDFVIAFPGQTIVRTVDAAAKLTAPAVTATPYDAAAYEVEVQFVEAGPGDVAYEVEAYGTGLFAYTGFASGTSSPVVVPLELGPGEGLGVHVAATRGALDPFGGADQVDIAEYVFVSTVED